MDGKFELVAESCCRDKVKLSPLQPVQLMLIPYEKTKKSDRCGEIIGIRPDVLSQRVDLEGKVVVRGCAMLKPVPVYCIVLYFKRSSISTKYKA